MDGTGAARSPVLSQVNLMITGDTLATAPLLRHTSGSEWAYAGDARTALNHTGDADRHRRLDEMTAPLDGRKIAFLVANEGIEQIELTEPWRAVEEAGGIPLLVAPEAGSAQAYNHLDKGDTFDVDLTTEDLLFEAIDGVVLPGGVANPDQLRTDGPAVDFVRRWVSSGRPLAAICHGPWTLVEAGVVDGRTLTSWPSLQTDIRNAGGEWHDEEVVVCTSGPNTLISSRKPDDLKAFTQQLVDTFSAA
jgi:protease I